MMKCFSIFSSRTKTREESTKLANSTGLEEKKLRKFSFSKLKKATKNFNISLKIGDGVFGSVYKGSIKPRGCRGERLVVTIKKLTRNGIQGHKEWLAEVEFLGVVEHPNIVKLLGYCSVLDGEKQREIRILVYEYMPNKSLEAHLFSKELPPIPWEKRLQILLGAAQGLVYLHQGLETKVIFHDFNSANVSLDENFNPKLSDFRVEKGEEVTDEGHAKLMIRYAPEYRETGQPRSNSDLWSFGVVLYDILSGRKVFDKNLPQSEKILIEWVKQFPPDSNMFWKIMDPRLNNQYSLSAAQKVAKMADGCLLYNPKDRPTMNEIIDVLQEAIKESKYEIWSPLPGPST